MPKELGDTVHEGSIIVPETTDGSGSKGDAVKENGSGKVTPTNASGDDIYGVLAEDMSGKSDGDTVSVVVFGPVVANAGGSVDKGGTVEASSTAGQVANNSNGKEATGGSFTGVFAPANPFALSESGGTYHGHSLGTNEAVILMR